MRQLGRTGVQVSDLCLGCMMFGGKTGPEPSYQIIDKAIESGINFLDTAPNWRTTTTTTRSIIRRIRTVTRTE